MRNCSTCIWTACPKFGRTTFVCGNYKPSLEEQKRIRIEEFAKSDHLTNDSQYNKGLDLIRRCGYRFVCTDPNVKYYVQVNNLN